MDATPSSEPRMGGTVEPANKAAAAGLQRADSIEKVMRYELHDPTEDLTYRVKTFDEAIAKAAQLGATRFHAVDADGARFQVNKVSGLWHREAVPRPALQRETNAPTTNVVPLAASASAAAVREPEDADSLRAARVERLEAALHERYVIKRAAVRLGDMPIGQTEYRFRGDATRVAFTESTFKLATDTNNPSVARSMVDVAEARDWRALRIAGSEDFKRLVWLEATLRGVRTVGYEPHPADLQLLRQERDARQMNRIEPVQHAPGEGDAAPSAKSSERGSGSRKVVLAVLQAVLLNKGIPARQRDAVMRAAEENLAARQRNGETVKVRVYDKAAPSIRSAIVVPRDAQRTRERAALVR